MFTTIEEFKASVIPKHRKLDCAEDVSKGDILVTAEGKEYMIMDILNYNDIFVIEYGVLH